MTSFRLSIYQYSSFFFNDVTVLLHRLNYNLYNHSPVGYLFLKIYYFSITKYWTHGLVSVGLKDLKNTFHLQWFFFKHTGTLWKPDPRLIINICQVIHNEI